MARLNEVPAAAESLETLKRRIYRQNRDLAKSNNARALRIKELEKDCACMLSENLELRARILELERQLEDNETRRISDHTLAIKARLEAQLEEWGGIIAELGLEPGGSRTGTSSRNRVSPKRRRTSLIALRPSPSQRRLRDVARDVEELGHISENKSGPRRSMKYESWESDPEQILALRSEADISVDSIELGPPPVSLFIEEDPIKIDSPRRAEPGQERVLDTFEPESLATGIPLCGSIQDVTIPASPTRPVQDSSSFLEETRAVDLVPESPPDQPAKAGSKRKLAARDEGDSGRSKRAINGNSNAKEGADKSSLRREPTTKASGEESASRPEMSEKETRQPLANKSTNDDVSSSNSRKHSKTLMKSSAIDQTAITRRIASKSRPTKTKAKTAPANGPEVISMSEEEPLTAAPEIFDLTTPITEPVLLAPNTPELAATIDASRGDTPPPLDISSSGETLRPSRRNRATISYAEPNLRDKMRRPTKALFDAVAGEGKYSRRTSQTESTIAIPADADAPFIPSQLESVPASPGAEQELAIGELPASVVTARRKRPSNAVSSGLKADIDLDMTAADVDDTKDTSIRSDHVDVKADVYEFTGSSPPRSKDRIKDSKRSNRRQTTSSRRSSTTIHDGNERSNSRRKSMMV